jgi:glutamate 5-kinase
MNRSSLRYRSVIPEARRVVIKIGSRVLVQKTGRPDKRRMRSLVREIAAIQAAGHEVVVVSSGAVGAGMAALGMKQRPESLPELQMAAAVGQTRLMSHYAELFEQRNCKVGQVLLTHFDFQHKVRFTNARRTMESLIRHNVIPIINENDVVADEEIRADLTLGDNDYLASLVVNLIRADLLILLTTVDGLRESGAGGRTRRVRYLESITRKTYALVNAHDSHLSKGGMGTKLKAAASIAKAGSSAVIANGRQTGVLTSIMAGDDVGTLVLASAV